MGPECSHGLHRVKQAEITCTPDPDFLLLERWTVTHRTIKYDSENSCLFMPSAIACRIQESCGLLLNHFIGCIVSSTSSSHLLEKVVGYIQVISLVGILAIFN